jgi:hypothetical protein
MYILSVYFVAYNGEGVWKVAVVYDASASFPFPRLVFVLWLKDCSVAAILQIQC